MRGLSDIIFTQKSEKFRKNLYGRLPVVFSGVLALSIWQITIFTGAMPLYAVAFYLWIILLAYTIVNSKRFIILLLYLISFFILLMSRDFLQQFFHIRVERYKPNVLNHVYLCFIISLLSIIAVVFGYNWFCNKKYQRQAESSSLDSESKIKKLKLRIDDIVAGKTFGRTIFLIYLAIFGFAFAYKIIAAYYAQTHSYYEYHATFPVIVQKNPLLYLISKIDLMICIIFAFVAQCRIGRISKIFFFSSFLIYSSLSLLIGQRFQFVICLFQFVLIFNGLFWALARKTRIKIISAIAILGLAFSLIFQAMEIMRGTFIKVVSNPLVSLLYTQGSSVIVIRGGYLLDNRLNPEKYYSLSFLKYGFLGRLFGGEESFQGHTVANALNGNSYSHSISYAINPKGYLNGISYGSSYIAESYHDFGYSGVLIFSIILAAAIVSYASFQHLNYFVRVSQIILLPGLIWSIRGETTGALTTYLAPSAICVYGIVALIILFLYWKSNKYMPKYAA